MKFLGIIPARAGSKGIPNKNIKLLGKKPLIQYTFESSLNSKLINELIVSTDSEEIAEFAIKYGIKVPFLRPKNLAEDNTSTIDVIIHALNAYKTSYDIDAVCLLQPTCPFRANDDIDNAINKYIYDKSDSLISVREVPHIFNPHWVFEKQENGLLKLVTGENKIIPQRQLLPKAYYRDGSIYITSKNTLLKGSLFGKRISYYETKGINVNLDTIEDWKIAEKIVGSQMN